MTKIMLVEDDQSLREIYSIRLVAEGYEIVSAGDGEEALAVAVREKPTLIISDVMMPKISGFDMLDILRSTPETKDIKVIMMTALSSEDQRKRGEALGADRYLVKSQVGIEDVVNTVHEVLGDRPESATPPLAPAPKPAPKPVPKPAPKPAQPPRPAQPLPRSNYEGKIANVPTPGRPAPARPVAPARPKVAPVVAKNRTEQSVAEALSNMKVTVETKPEPKPKPAPRPVRKGPPTMEEKMDALLNRPGGAKTYAGGIQPSLGFKRRILTSVPPTPSETSPTPPTQLPVPAPVSKPDPAPAPLPLDAPASLNPPSDPPALVDPPASLTPLSDPPTPPETPTGSSTQPDTPADSPALADPPSSSGEDSSPDLTPDVEPLPVSVPTSASSPSDEENLSDADLAALNATMDAAASEASSM